MKTKASTTINSCNSQGNTEARVTNPEKVRQIIEQYIDQVDVGISNNGFVWHPVWLDRSWKSETAFPEEDIILKMMDKPHGLQKVNDMAKAAIKDFIRKHSLDSIFRNLGMPYSFKILRDAKEHMSADDFTRLLRTTWEAHHFCFYEDDDFSNDDLWELLQSCDPQKFMTSDELEWYEHDTPPLVSLYRGDDDQYALVWAFSPVGVIVNSGGRFGDADCYQGYTAHIKKEDIFAVNIDRFDGGYIGFIVNPDKLYRVEFEQDLRGYCDRDELSEDDWEGWDWGDEDDEDDDWDD